MKWSIYFRTSILYVMRSIMMLWVSPKVVTKKIKIKESKKNPVFYVFNVYSLADLLVLDKVCQSGGFPNPIYQEKNRCFYLRCSKSWISKFFIPNDYLFLNKIFSYLEEKECDDIHVIPVSIFWGRSPINEKSAFKLFFNWNLNIGGEFKKFLATIIHGKNVTVYVDKDFSVKDNMRENFDISRNSRWLGRILRVYFRRLKNSVIGPDLLQRKSVIEYVLNSNNIKNMIVDISYERGVSEKIIFDEAEKYTKEIVSDYKFSIVSFMNILLKYFFEKLYLGIDVYHANKVKEISMTHTIVYLPCHRSHIDYLLLSYVIYYQGLTLPYIASGVNLNLPVLGSFLRKCGAFFIRRTFKENKLYGKIMGEYLNFLYTRGFSVKYFIEGGRSRTGRVMKSKIGMLSLTLQSFFRNNGKPIALVPTYIGYEKVLEVGSYLHELRGKKKKKESVIDIIKIIFSLKGNFGRAAVNFGSPICIEKFLDSKYHHWRKLDNLVIDKKWINQVSNVLSKIIMERINESVVVNPVNLIAMALLSMPRYAIGEEELIQVIRVYSKLLNLLPYSCHYVFNYKSEKDLISYVENLGFINIEKDSIGNIIKLKESVAAYMTYYKNNIMHLFVIPSLISCLFVNNVFVSRRDLLRAWFFLYPYLKSEYFLKWSKIESLRIFKKWFFILQSENLITHKGGGVYLQSDTGKKEFFILRLLSRIVEQTIERFYLTTSLLIKNSSGSMGTEELGEKARDFAQRMSCVYGSNAPESFDRKLFHDFLEQLQKNGILWKSDSGMLLFGKDLVNTIKEAHKLLGSDICNSVRQVL